MTVSANYPTISPSLELDFANTQALDPRVTFTRSTTATYYNGITNVLAEQNLQTYSENLSFWTLVNETVTGGSTAPDGNSSAYLIQETSTNAQHYVWRTDTPTILPNMTISFFFKNGSVLTAFNVITGNQNFGVIVTPNAGAAPTVTNFSGVNVAQNITITAYQNSWYRISFTSASNIGTVGTLLFWTTTNTGNYVGTTNVGYYLWGVQIEQRSSATAYNVTTSTAITNYIPQLLTAAINQPRFDCNPLTSESLGLLIEEQRTNLLTYSSDISNAVWTKYTSNFAYNQAIAPDGTQTGTVYTLVAGINSNQGYFYNSISATAQAYTHSVYIKPVSWFLFALTNLDGLSTSYNLQTMSVISGEGGTSTGTITSVGNGWYRLTRTVTATAGTQYPVVIAIPSFPRIGGVVNWTPSTNNTFYVWGNQLEAGSFATSYIPTTSAAVTRNADSASMTGTNFSSWYNIAQGTWYGETPSIFRVNSAGYDYPRLLNNSTTAATPLAVRYDGAGIAYNSTSILATNNTVAAGTPIKLASSYSTTGFTMDANAGTVATTTALMTVYSGIVLGKQNDSTNYINGTIKKLAYYPQAVTSAQLVALTGS